MSAISRRQFLGTTIAASASLATAADAQPVNVHQQLLDLADEQERQRRARFAAINTRADLEGLQRSLREKFLHLLGGLPESRGVPPVRRLGHIDADDYVVDKLVFESFPGYFVPALLYKPKKTTGRCPGVISPCGHSAVGKAAGPYQMLHINLVKRGYVVLTYDPVGQGERSQFWDVARGRSRFNLTCGEHAVLGNPLYLLGSSLARYRIWDGMRGIDYLASLPEVDPTKIGCVGNSGGGTLTAYIAALDPRVAVAAICCYITTLPRRMGNRIQTDPDADPEQDIFGFVSEGIDHAGLLALRAPRPTLLGTARFDFFPIEGARESFAEARRLFEVAGVGQNIERAEAAERHGLSLPLRRAVYDWFERHLAGRQPPGLLEEIKVTPRPTKELLVCPTGQVNQALLSRSLLPLALVELQRRSKPARAPLRNLLPLDPAHADFRLTEVAAGSTPPLATIVLLNGNESRDWRDEKALLADLAGRRYRLVVLDPRGVGALRPELSVRGHEYADPLAGVEENIAYNAFLVGKSLVAMRVTDVLAAVRKLRGENQPIILCGRRDAALVACLAAAIEPAIRQVAVEEMRLSYLPLFGAEGQPINAASILPNMLRDFGDIPDVLAQIAPRRLLVAGASGRIDRPLASMHFAEQHFSREPRVLTDWLAG